jgi:hypothetical protein
LQLPDSEGLCDEKIHSNLQRTVLAVGVRVSGHSYDRQGELIYQSRLPESRKIERTEREEGREREGWNGEKAKREKWEKKQGT